MDSHLAHPKQTPKIHVNVARRDKVVPVVESLRTRFHRWISSLRSIEARGRDYSGFGMISILFLIVVVCIVLWHYERLQPWIASIGSAMVTILGTAPGLMNPEMQRKWLALVGVAALIGLGTLFASKYEEAQRDNARNSAEFSKSLLRRSGIAPAVGDQLCKGAAREIQQLVLGKQFGEVLRRTEVLRIVQPGNGHVLAFEGYAYRGLKDYGSMLTAFNNYEHNADKNQADALSGAQEDCYDRPSGFCAERTALVAHYLADYSYLLAQTSRGAAKIQNLQDVVTHEKDMLKTRTIGFRGDSSVPDSVSLLRDTAGQLAALGQPADEALAMAHGIEEERRKRRAEAEATSTRH
jgi:hypothetical protein